MGSWTQLICTNLYNEFETPFLSCWTVFIWNGLPVENVEVVSLEKNKEETWLPSVWNVLLFNDFIKLSLSTCNCSLFSHYINIISSRDLIVWFIISTSHDVGSCGMLVFASLFPWMQAFFNGTIIPGSNLGARLIISPSQDGVMMDWALGSSGLLDFLS